MAQDKDPIVNVKDTNSNLNDWEKFLKEASTLLADDLVESDEKIYISNSEEFLIKERDSYIKFDTDFSRFLKNFVDNQEKKERQKIILKYVFFFMIMIGFFLLIMAPIAVLHCATYFSEISLIVALVSGLIELAVAIIVLPKIIAEYLFNKEEDANMLQIIKNMQDYNEQKHKHIKEHNK